MARGFGAKPERTKKCKCESPGWHAWELRVTAAGELVITLECENCKALWDSKSREARKHVNLKGTAHFSNSTRQVTTYKDVMERADRFRQECLIYQIENKKAAIEELQKELTKAQKELDFLKDAPLVP